MEKKHVLVTGGCGYIGCHVVLELVASGHTCVVVDNLSNSSASALQKVGDITGQPDAVEFRRVDITDESLLEDVFRTSGPFDVVLHLAGL